MTLLHEAVDQKKFDVRVIEKNIAKGLVNASDVTKHVSQLPDDAEFAEYISIESLNEDAAPKSKSENAPS